MVVPELELEVSTGTLGGLVTTVEGLVRAVETALKNTQVLLQFVHVHIFVAWCMRSLLHPPSVQQARGVLVDDITCGTEVCACLQACWRSMCCFGMAG